MQACWHDAATIRTTTPPPLRQKLAEHHGVEVEQILVARRPDRVSGHARPDVSGARAERGDQRAIVHRLPPGDRGGGRAVDRSADAPRTDSIWMRIAAAVNRNTRIVFLANPNNPTGTLVTADEVDHLPEAVSRSSVVVLDEAYYDFAQYFAARRGVDIFAFPGLRARGTQRRGAADVFQSARPGRSARRVRDCVRRIDRAHLAPAFDVLRLRAGPGGSPGGAGRCSTHSQGRRKQHRRVAAAATRQLSEIGYARHSDLGEFSVLRHWARTPAISPNACRPRESWCVRWSSGALPKPSASPSARRNRMMRSCGR